MQTFGLTVLGPLKEEENMIVNVINMGYRIIIFLWPFLLAAAGFSMFWL